MDTNVDTTAPAPVDPKINHPKFVRWAIVIGIVIVLNIFFVVVRSLALPEPQYQDYCPTNYSNVTNAAQCDAAGGIWTDNGPAMAPDKTVPATPTGYCDFYAKCQPVYEAVMAKYDMYAFSLMIVLGLISIVAGTFIPLGSSIVSTGLSYGGVVAFIIGSGMYWNEAGNWVRLLISFIALVALLYIGWKRFRD